MTNGQATAQQSREIHQQSTLQRPPRLLLLAYLFPPAVSIACLRTWNVAKYLARLGWDVTVVTPHPSIWRNTENAEAVVASLEREGINRILTGHRWPCLSPYQLNCWNHGFGWFVGGVCRSIARHLDINQEVGWVKSVEWACATLTAKDVDVIFASGSPFRAFHLAKRLSDRLGRPYVLDYRDPWTVNPHVARSSKPATIEEAQLLEGCTAVTIVSPSWGLAMERHFSIGPKLHVLTNGYDPEELTDVNPHNFGHFAIVYAGNFYPPKRVISPVMAALKRLKEIMHREGGEWYFHYYGAEENHVREEARQFGVMERVVLHGRVSRSEALSALKGAGVATVITMITEEDSLEDRGMVTGKLFELLGLNTPILLIAPPGSDAIEIASQTEVNGSFCGSDIEGISRFLARLISGDIRRHDAAPGLTYAWPALARRLDGLLRSISTSSHPGLNGESAAPATPWQSSSAQASCTGSSGIKSAGDD